LGPHFAGNPERCDSLAIDAHAHFPKWLEDGKQTFFTADTSPGLQNWVMQLMLTTPLQVAIECNRQITSTDFRGELPGIMG
jgi:hypothetical protein